MVKAELTEKNAVFLSFVTGVHTAWGFCTKKACCEKFHNKMSFSKNSSF